MSLHQSVIAALVDELRRHKRYGEKAMAQLGDEDLFVKLNPEQNSIAVIVKHMAGNMVSRFTDFLTSDGEKPTRDRDSEFVEQVMPRQEVVEMWEGGWKVVFAAIDALEEGDLEKTVYIRRDPLSAVLALTRQAAHYAYHVGQIVLIAKHIKTSRGEAWDYMTIGPGGSKAFNEMKGMR